MMEHIQIRSDIRDMTGETAKQWGSAGLGRREEAASQPQSNGKAIEVSIFLQAHIQTKRENPFAAAQQPLCHGFAIASPRLPIAYTFEKCYTFT